MPRFQIGLSLPVKMTLAAVAADAERTAQARQEHRAC